MIFKQSTIHIASLLSAMLVHMYVKYNSRELATIPTLGPSMQHHPALPQIHL